MNRFLTSIAAVFALGVTLAIAQIGTFAPNMPNIGGPSYCSSQVNAACVNTVPAGPALTGIETIPADTNAPLGVPTQSGRLTLPTIGAGLLVYNVPVTGDSITLTAATRQLIVEPAGTIAALTVVLPAATTLVNGQRIGICGTQIVTTLTITPGTGTTVSNTATAMLVPVATGAASCPEWVYYTAGTKWYRVQ